MKKALIIRFNAIGDIVLTTPVIDALSDAGYEVHYLLKSAYAPIIENHPKVARLWLYGKNQNNLIPALKREEFDYVIDLHNNLRSVLFRIKLGVPARVLKKNRLADLLMVHFNFARKQRPHIVHRFLDVVVPLSGIVQNPEPAFYFPKDGRSSGVKLPSENYICIAVGTAHPTKDIPLEKLLPVIQYSEAHVILLGGSGDRDRAEALMDAAGRHEISNLTGTLSIDQSAYVLSRSRLLICGDTGLMHIAAALGIPTVSLFGSTHPILGYTPYYSDDAIPRALIQNSSLSCRPCTRQGRSHCPKGHFKCMMDISVDEIAQKVEGILGS